MSRFLTEFSPNDSTRILDVGGTEDNWELTGYRGEVVLLNLRTPEEHLGSTNLKYVEGDGRRLSYADGSFSIGFSNSVIEHLHTLDEQRRFAKEIRRVCKNLWVQTPARWFPFEPHWLTPFVHFVPKPVRRRLIRNFTVYGWVMRPDQKQVDELLAEYRLLTFGEMKELFPDCEIRRERFAGLTKAYIAVRHRD